MIPRHVETLYCDDIRHELGGKLSFIGVYSGGLFVQAFPVTLPKLCLSIKILTSSEEPLRQLRLRVLKDDELLHELVLDDAQLEGASELAEEMPEERRKQSVQMGHFIIVMSPMQFDGPCTLKVWAETEDGALRGLSLKVDQAPSPPEHPVSTGTD